MTDRYTHGHHESVLRAHRWRNGQNSAGYLLPHLRSGDRLLDVGCGPASITSDLARHVAPGSVIALDNALGVLALARTALAEQAVRNVELHAADVYALPFASGTFAVTHAHQVLQHLSDPVAALAEMRRVTARGGLVACRDADYPAMTWFPELPALDRWMQLYLTIARNNRAEPAAGRRLHAWARAAGFSDITASASLWCFSTAQDRRWWGSLWAERVVASAFADQAVRGGWASRHELEDLAAAWREWSEAEDGWFVVVHGEVLARA